MDFEAPTGHDGRHADNLAEVIRTADLQEKVSKVKEVLHVRSRALWKKPPRRRST